MNNNFKKIIILLVVVVLSITFLSKKDNKKEVSYWEQNNCSRGIPEQIIESDLLVGQYSFKLDNQEGTALEEFEFNNKRYSIGHLGCSNFDIKILLPINKENLSRQVLIEELKNLREISNSEYIFNDLINNFDTLIAVDYNLRNYSCDEGVCDFYTVILEPIDWNGENYIPVKITYVL
mgnify:CR=1 FL=1